MLQVGILRCYLYALLLFLGPIGCATTQYSDGASPDSTATVVAESGLTIPATVRYEGNPDYLPRTLVRSQDEQPITAVYLYQVIYNSEKEHPLTVFNPLLIAGMSKSEDAVIILAQLEFFKGQVPLKKYEKAVTLSKSKTLFSEGETLTEMRRNGLLHVRDSIDQQVNADQVFWRKEVAQ